MKDKIFKIEANQLWKIVKITNNGICIYNTASIPYKYQNKSHFYFPLLFNFNCEIYTFIF
jgi:hypothetical protein